MKDAIYKIKGVELKNLRQEFPLERWFYEMVQKSENELTVKDVSHMLRQEVYLDMAIPIAWKEVIENPLCGEMYEGQMIELLTRVFASNPDLKEWEKYRMFEKKLEEISEIYEGDCNYEKEEFEKILIAFRRIFE